VRRSGYRIPSKKSKQGRGIVKIGHCFAGKGNKNLNLLLGHCFHRKVQISQLELEPDSQPDPNSSVSETHSHPEASGSSSSSHPEFGPMTFDQYKNDMKVSSGLQELILPGQDMPKYLDFFNADRVIVEMDKIVKLFEGQCVEIIGCTRQRKVVD